MRADASAGLSSMTFLAPYAIAASIVRISPLEAPTLVRVSGRSQSLRGAHSSATIRPYLADAAKHDVGPLDVLAHLFGGEGWKPPRST